MVKKQEKRKVQKTCINNPYDNKFGIVPKREDQMIVTELKEKYHKVSSTYPELIEKPSALMKKIGVCIGLNNVTKLLEKQMVHQFHSPLSSPVESLSSPVQSLSSEGEKNILLVLIADGMNKQLNSITTNHIKMMCSMCKIPCINLRCTVEILGSCFGFRQTYVAALARDFCEKKEDFQWERWTNSLLSRLDKNLYFHSTPSIQNILDKKPVLQPLHTDFVQTVNLRVEKEHNKRSSAKSTSDKSGKSKINAKDHGDSENNKTEGTQQNQRVVNSGTKPNKDASLSGGKSSNNQKTLKRRQEKPLSSDREEKKSKKK